MLRHLVPLITMLLGFGAGYAVRARLPLSAELPRTQLAASPLVCLRADSPAEPTDDLELRWCEMQLGEAHQRLQSQRLAWPQLDLGPFHPGVFHDSLDEAVRGCDAEVLAVECSEFPCVGVLRASQPRALAEGCPGLEELLGEGAAPHLTPMPCPDGGSVLVPLVWGSDDEELLEAHVRPLVDTGLDEAFGDWQAIMRVAGRRMDDALSLAGELCNDRPE